MCVCGRRRLPGGARGGPGSSPFLTTYAPTPTSNARVYSRNSEESFLLRCLLRHCPRLFPCGHLIDTHPPIAVNKVRPSPSAWAPSPLWCVPYLPLASSLTPSPLPNGAAKVHGQTRAPGRVPLRSPGFLRRLLRWLSSTPGSQQKPSRFPHLQGRSRKGSRCVLAVR